MPVFVGLLVEVLIGMLQGGKELVIPSVAPLGHDDTLPVALAQLIEGANFNQLALVEDADASRRDTPPHPCSG